MAGMETGVREGGREMTASTSGGWSTGNWAEAAVFLIIILYWLIKRDGGDADKK